jgi:hypothetical protein
MYSEVFISPKMNQKKGGTNEKTNICFTVSTIGAVYI